jgi:hypothetical protein
MIYLLSHIFIIETDITGLIGGLRLVPALYVILMVFSIRHKKTA